MSYRKITVDDKPYQYVIGKTHVKIKGVGAWPKEEVGAIVTIDCGCDCGCYSTEETIWTRGELEDFRIANGHEKHTVIKVTPLHISQKIKATK